MKNSEILSKLPYQEPFLFVDEILEVDESHIVGTYTFPSDSWFYSGHFKDKPVTPGVLLTECMAQIGLVCLGIFINECTEVVTTSVAFTSSEVEFFLPVFPNEKVTVKSVKKYFRFQKLKCEVQMNNQEGEMVCKGTLAGMFRNETSQ